MARRRKPRDISPALLEQAALDYLARFAASAKGVRQVLGRRIMRAARAQPELDTRQANAWADAVVEKLKSRKLLDDAAFAALKVGSLSRSGRSKARIAQTLAAKGVARAITDTALSHHAEENPGAEYRAALAYAKRRRLGPFGQAKRGEEPAARLKRELASFARQGFKADIALRILKASGVELDQDTLGDYPGTD